MLRLIAVSPAGADMQESSLPRVSCLLAEQLKQGLFVTVPIKPSRARLTTRWIRGRSMVCVSRTTWSLQNQHELLVSCTWRTCARNVCVGLLISRDLVYDAISCRSHWQNFSRFAAGGHNSHQARSLTAEQRCDALCWPDSLVSEPLSEFEVDPPLREDPRGFEFDTGLEWGTERKPASAAEHGSDDYMVGLLVCMNGLRRYTT